MLKATHVQSRRPRRRFAEYLRPACTKAVEVTVQGALKKITDTFALYPVEGKLRKACNISL
jgi:hypothetical protein